MSAKSQFRCAIYTRKSSEEGLEQDFNSLHAQRESCEAYILSQAGEGWKALPKLYDDGGFSGGNTERPGLKLLLADIAAGLIDIVVVYKVDRLTRSLTDFAKIVDVFDKHGASFVSVTQAFNTTTSMGRLTLNVLLSFAQFEREVTSERIRDKVAASKKKGLWMGGTIPLGYDADGRTMKINEVEATTVRHIYRRYLELGSVHELANELEAHGYVSKPRVKADGSAGGSRPIGRGALYHLLSNRLYLGEIVHKDASYPGLHPAIIDRRTFEAVQLERAKQPRVSPTRSSEIPFGYTGKLFERDGRPLTPTTTINRHGRRYRYYITAGGRRTGEYRDKSIQRLPAGELDAALTDILVRGAGPGETADAALIRAEITGGRVEITLSLAGLLLDGEIAEQKLSTIRHRFAEADRVWLTKLGTQLKIDTALNLPLRGGRARVAGGQGNLGPMPNRQLLAALRKAHKIAGRAGLSAPAAGALVAIDGAYERRLVALAYMAPAIQQALLNGTHPPTLTLEQLLIASSHITWKQQLEALGDQIRSTSALPWVEIS